MALAITDGPLYLMDAASLCASRAMDGRCGVRAIIIFLGKKIIHLAQYLIFDEATLQWYLG